MAKYTAVNGTEFTDKDIENWADEHEHGYSGGHIGPGTTVSDLMRGLIDAL